MNTTTYNYEPEKYPAVDNTTFGPANVMTEPVGLPPPQEAQPAVFVMQKQPVKAQNMPRQCPNDYRTASILACLFCFWPTAIAALVYSSQVEDCYKNGDYEGAVKASRNAGRWARISFILGVVWNLVSTGVIVGLNLARFQLLN